MQTTKLFLCLVISAAILVAGSVDEDAQIVEQAIYNYYDVVPNASTQGLLYPRESETRELRSLDGLWRFLKCNISDPEQGEREQWYASGLDKTGHTTIVMPVPASYNDVTVDATLRDHIGTVWYERQFFVPSSWARQQRTWLRFGSVHYKAVVWINGKQALQHSIGHLPFEADITQHLVYGAENRLTLSCDNRLGNHTVPQGQISEAANDDGVSIIQSYTFDFFNYAGIHRSVHLYTTPLIYISDITLHTELEKQQTARIRYQLHVGNHLPSKAIYLLLKVRDQTGQVVAQQKNVKVQQGMLLVRNVQLWWPYLMHEQPGYMYNMEFALHATEENKLLDVYRLPYGIRGLTWSNSTFLINGKPLYLRGFGKHEDADIRGKGLDLALLTRDYSLLKWLGANAYRTSHYPYSEESMQFADQHGIMIINECPSVNTDIFEPQLLRNHMSALEQLIHRDRNHASVIAWSIANEPRSSKKAAGPYFGNLTKYVRSIAHQRPLTAAINVELGKDLLAQFLDIVGFNRYNAWYQNAGHLDMITRNVYNEAKSWHVRYQKPVIMFEYGADTLEGYHALPAFIWSEDYQAQLFSRHFEAFDKLLKLDWFIGEFVWNFADFKTAQTFTRVGGNKKGVFTRNRQPKQAAILLRRRYHALAFKLNNESLPADLFDYIIDWS